MAETRLSVLWGRVLERVSPEIAPRSVETWLKPTALTDLTQNEAVLSVPNHFFGGWIKEHYTEQIQRALAEEIGQTQISVSFVVSQPTGEDASSVVASPEPIRTRKRRSYTIEKYVFDLPGTHTNYRSFVVGAGNAFAFSSAKRVAEKPGEAYNPFFLYGGVGLGKTHLANAIGNFVLAHSPSTRVRYVTAEQFTNDVIQSIRLGQMDELRNRYRNIDILLVDDIQFIAGKERTQEEFFHTFNALFDSGKQVVLTSDRSTKTMSEMDDRLRSRFEMGLMADVQLPDLETRVAILRQKSEEEGIALPQEVAFFLATHIKTSVRELEGALIRLGAFSSLSSEEMTVEMAKRTLRDTLQEKKKVITIDDIQQAIATRFKIKLSELRSKRRTRNIVHPRQIGMYLSREMTRLSYPEIGRAFGGKDHATVIHACRQIEKNKADDPNLNTLLESLSYQLNEA